MPGHVAKAGTSTIHPISFSLEENERSEGDRVERRPFTLPSPPSTQHWKIDSLLSRIRVTAVTKHLPQARCFIPSISVFSGVVLPSRQLCLHFPGGNRFRNGK